MDKPKVGSFSHIAPLVIQQYERYLPTAFDESFSILERINKIIQRFNEMGLLLNEVVDRWNEVMEWVMADGLTESVNAKLDEFVADGTMDTIINQNIFNELSGRVDTALETSSENKSDLDDRGINIRSYSSDVSNGDWSGILQLLADTGGRYILPTGLDIRVDSAIVLSKPIEFIGYDTEIHSDVSPVFTCTGAFERLKMSGLVYKSNAVGETSNVFLTTENANIGRIDIRDNDFGFGRVIIKSPYDTKLKVEDNRWLSTSNTYNLSSILQIQIGEMMNEATKATRVFRQRAIVRDNYFKLHGRSGNNVDVIKITGATKGLIFEGNYVENTNLSSQAELDTYTGGHMMKLLNNYFKNVAIKRQQDNGSYPDNFEAPELSYDLIQGNTFEFTPENVIHQTAMLLKGSLFSVIGNQIIKKMGTVGGLFRGLNIQANDVIYDEFGTVTPVGMLIHNNLFDLRFTSNPNSHVIKGIHAPNGESASISGNLMIGGNIFWDSFKRSTAVGNAWLKSENGDPNAGMNMSETYTKIGNVTDSVVTRNSVDINNANGVVFTPKTISGTSEYLSVRDSSYHEISGTGTITTIDFIKKGQEFVVYALNGVVTIENNNRAKLKGNVNAAIPAGGIIKLLGVSDNLAIEVGRSF